MEKTRRVYYAQLQASRDLKLLFAGSMVGGSSAGSRPYHLLHYITRGKGTVTVEDRRWELAAGDLFVNHPGRPVVYRPVRGDPWGYFWMGFDGGLAGDLIDTLTPNSRRPVCRGEFDPEIERLFRDLLQSLSGKSMAAALRSDAIMRLILGRLLRASGRDSNTSRAGTPLLAVRQAQEFMLMHHAEPIGVTDVCSVTGYERTYFSNLFCRETGQTMQDYLSSIRITKACKLLTTTELTVAAIARRVGYAEYRSFSRWFSKMMGLSPSQYRRAHSPSG